MIAYISIYMSIIIFILSSLSCDPLKYNKNMRGNYVTSNQHNKDIVVICVLYNKFPFKVDNIVAYMGLIQ